MPTENRSSNTEQMVSVPRSLLEESCNGLRITQDRARKGLRALLAQPAAQHQGDPDRALKDALFACLAAGGDDREYGGVATAGDRQGWVRFTTVAAGAQHQGEPVAWKCKARNGGTGRYSRIAETEGEMLDFVSHYKGIGATIETMPLYAHPAAGEVEQGYHNSVVEGLMSRQNELREERDTLRAEVDQFKLANARLSKENVDRRNQLAEREAALDALNEIATGYKRDLDERDALLRDINKRHSSGVDFDLPADLAARVAAVCATSAEPSAPVERDERAEFQREGRYIVIKLGDLAKVPAAVVEPFAEQLTAIQRRLPSRQYVVVESDWPEYEPTWAAIQARAALERKS